MALTDLKIQRGKRRCLFAIMLFLTFPASTKRTRAKEQELREKTINFNVLHGRH
jgi:hypothetical protein